ncbi:MAG: hypothetical protein A4E64_01431 [Syntrophorhabdus sp. PtaU1.Bin058]|nr:MAG: hypothetical protein A4E64_01431 [Syntrophorhabdus sp. PtaU1.Bin058]
MGNQNRLTAYVGYHTLSLLAKAGAANDAAGPEQEAMQVIWGYHKKDRLRLVTSGEAMEMDMVIAFNTEGCCVTDTYMITENIEAFETWDRVDRDLTAKWKQVVDLFDQLEVLDREREGTQGAEDTLFSFIREEVLCEGGNDTLPQNRAKDDVEILHNCARHFQEWYGEDRWRDLRRIEYDLNWKILESELLQRSIEPVFEGEEGAQNRCLLGLLNRVVGFSKKSCPMLPMNPRHIDFVVEAVMKKYGGDRREHEVRHIVHCIEHDVDFLITVDEDLTARFNGKRHELSKHPACCSIKLTLVTPSQLVNRLIAQNP